VVHAFTYFGEWVSACETTWSSDEGARRDCSALPRLRTVDVVATAGVRRPTARSARSGPLLLTRHRTCAIPSAMADDLEDEIRAKTDSFAKRLSVLLRRAVLEAATVELAPSAHTRVASKRAPTGRGGGNGSAIAQRAPGQKRPAAELARVTDVVAEYIKAH